MAEGAAPSPAAAPAPAAAGTELTTGQGAQVEQQEGTPENPGIRIKPIPPRRERIKFAPEELPTVSPDGEAIPKGYKPHLPGVITDDTGAEEIPSLARPRDPATGKFVKQGSERPEMPGEVPPEGVPGEKPELPEGQKPPEPGKIKFLGREYNSIADIEQVHRTLQGQHQKQLDERRKLVEERDYGYQAGNAWKAEYDKLKAQVEGRAPAAQAQPQTQGTGQMPQSVQDFDVDAVVSGIDMNAFEMIAAHPRGGLPNAGKYLVAETLRAVQEKLVPALLAQVDQRFQSIEAPEQARAAQANQLQQFELVAGMSTMDGEPAFPELQDESAVGEIGELWGRAKKRPLETAQDIIDAVALYRLMKSFARPPAQGRPAGEIPQVPTPAPGAAASLEAEPVGLAPANGGRAEGSPEQRRLVAALDKVELVDPILGFRRNY